MKKLMILFVTLTIVLSITGADRANALAYLGADIAISGTNYSDISSERRWFEIGTDIYTFWDWQGVMGGEFGWVEYEAYLTTGNWNVGLNAINFGRLGSEDWYPSFMLYNSFNDDIITIQSSDTEVHNGFTNIDISEDGLYSFRYTWINDKWGPENYYPPRDANIRIKSAFFDNTSTQAVPEPTTLILMGGGFIGLGLVRRFRRK